MPLTLIAWEVAAVRQDGRLLLTTVQAATEAHALLAALDVWSGEGVHGWSSSDAVRTRPMMPDAGSIFSEFEEDAVSDKDRLGWVYDQVLRRHASSMIGLREDELSGPGDATMGFLMTAAVDRKVLLHRRRLADRHLTEAESVEVALVQGGGSLETATEALDPDEG